jgi:hypothetical protein
MKCQVEIFHRIIDMNQVLLQAPVVTQIDGGEIMIYRAVDFHVFQHRGWWAVTSLSDTVSLCIVYDI